MFEEFCQVLEFIFIFYSFYICIPLEIGDYLEIVFFTIIHGIFWWGTGLQMDHAS